MPWKNLLFVLLGAFLVCVGIFGKNLQFYTFQNMLPSNVKIPNRQGRIVSIIIGTLFIVGAIFARR
jgi:hypothetical protein